MKHLYSGKVRELYETGDGVLLLVATDRISAFDHVLETPIPDKGKILTQLSLWWFDRLGDIIPNDVITNSPRAAATPLTATQVSASRHRWRSTMLCVIPRPAPRHIPYPHATALMSRPSRNG